MKPISVLFYIEPVCYRFDPLMLRPCTEWIMSLMHADTRDRLVSFAVVTSPFLAGILDEYAPTAYRRYEVDPRALIAPFDFDRHAYGRDLYGRDTGDSGVSPLPDILEKIKQDLSPDIVIAFSQNRYIEEVFSDRPVLFWEMGPLPRMRFSECYYIDPASAHGGKNLLNSQTARILNLPFDKATPEEILGHWEKIIAAPARAHARAPLVKAWLEEKRRGRKIALFAMQPPDWLTYEAAYDKIAPDDLMLRWLSELPPEWMAISTHHAHFGVPGLAATNMAAARLFPNFEPMPEALTSLHEFAMSEILMPHVDAVATISSAVGMTGLLWGKPVVTYGQCYLNSLCGRHLRELPQLRGLGDKERASLLMFLTNFYCHSKKDCLFEMSYFGEMLRKIRASADVTERYFDFSGWSLARMEKLLEDVEGL